MLKEYLLNEIKWQEFLNYKLDKEYVNKREKEALFDFISNKKYISICTSIINDEYVFSIPVKHVISKNSSKKKRIIYTYNNDEMMILKYISYLLYEYDYLFTNNLYSFRKNNGVQKAILGIKKIRNINNMYGYKVDISNYFNGIDVDILLNNLRNSIETDIYCLIKKLLTDKRVFFNKEVIEEEKGIMAGVPISAFLANYFIKKIDEFFWEKPVVYFRYADDILLFCNTKEELEKYVLILKEEIYRYKLAINKEKEMYFMPKDNFEFLGFSFENDKVDISLNSLKKIKAKIRRSTRGIRRWMIRKKASYESSLKALIRKFNRKFYGNENNELSWKYWFFPQINTDERLKIIDAYFQQEMRYLVTGKHNKRNYQVVPYELLKKCNYKPLVSEYYKSFLNVKNKV